MIHKEWSSAWTWELSIDTSELAREIKNVVEKFLKLLNWLLFKECFQIVAIRYDMHIMSKLS